MNVMDDVQFVQENLTVIPGSARPPMLVRDQDDCEIIFDSPLPPHKDLSPVHKDISPVLSPAHTNLSTCMMECGCCFSDTDLDEMVQCGDGHLFCVQCLKSYADEAIHGQGKSHLLCMTADCGAPFPRSQMQRALTDDIIKKFDERVQEESLNMANLSNLVRCPDCSYAAEIVDEHQQVFVCIRCDKRTCRHCSVDWGDHEGLTCSQVEKKDETSIRTKYEELMTQARVRFCPKCKTALLKEDGCNRVTCRCGGVICYICRQPGIDYTHFCQHVGPRGPSGCKSCKQCSLWTDAEADDRRIIAQLKKDGKIERVTQGFSEDKDIGAPEETGRKRQAMDPNATLRQRKRKAGQNRQAAQVYRQHWRMHHEAVQRNNSLFLPQIGLNVNIPIQNMMQAPFGNDGADLLTGINYPQQGPAFNPQFPHFNPPNPFMKADIRAQQPATIAHAQHYPYDVNAAASNPIAASNLAAATSADATSTPAAATSTPAAASTAIDLTTDAATRACTVTVTDVATNSAADSNITTPIKAHANDENSWGYAVSSTDESSVRAKVYRKSPSQKRPSTRRPGTSNTTNVASHFEGVKEGSTADQSVLLVEDMPAWAKGKAPALTKGKAPALTKGKAPALTKGKAPALTKGKAPALTKGKAPALTKGKAPALTKGEEPALTNGKATAQAEEGAILRTKNKARDSSSLTERLNTLLDEEDVELRDLEESFNQDMKQLIERTQEKRKTTIDYFKKQRTNILSLFSG